MSDVKVIDVNKELEKYKDGSFTEEQLAEIKQGLEDGMDVKIYANPGIPAAQMAHVRKGLYENKMYEREIELLEASEKSEKLDTVAQEKLEQIRNRRELAIIALVFFGISILLFVICLTKI